MKDFNSRILISVFVLLALSMACSAKSTATLTWDSSGNVSNDANQQIKIDLQNVYKGLNVNDGLYLLGFKIDKQGINYPTIAWAPNDLKNPGYWSFDEDLQDLFIYKKKVFLLTRSGDTFNRNADAWVKTAMTLKPDSVVVHSTGDVIACYPSPLLKTTPGVGGCYSVNNQWNININWTKIMPKVCSGYLLAVDRHNNEKNIRKISLDKGEILNSKKVAEDVKDLCLTKFK